MIEANPAVCEEEILLKRPEGWSVDDPAMGKQMLISLSVVPITCPALCEPGKMVASVTSCDCIDVVTEPAKGKLFMAHEYKVASVVRIMMDTKVPAEGEITIRQFAVGGKFPYVIPPKQKFECVEKIEDFATAHYEQMSLKAIVPDCRW